MLRLKIVILFSIFFFSHIQIASASLVSITNDGDVEWNVLPARDEILASSPKPERLTVTNVAETSASYSAKVKLNHVDGKITLTVNDGMQTQEADVTGYEDEIVEIEQEIAPAKISILADNDTFLIREQNVTARTIFPLSVEPEIKSIVVETQSGKHYLSILPSEALSQVVKGQIIDVIDADTINIVEQETGELEYAVAGKKTLRILNIFEYEVPVTANISVVDGQVSTVDQPLWLPLAAFLFA